jgi:hypothetical protein
MLSALSLTLSSPPSSSSSDDDDDESKFPSPLAKSTFKLFSSSSSSLV